MEPFQKPQFLKLWSQLSYNFDISLRSEVIAKADCLFLRIPCPLQKMNGKMHEMSTTSFLTCFKLLEAFCGPSIARL